MVAIGQTVSTRLDCPYHNWRMDMSQRLALLLTTGVSAFMLVTAGAVAGRVTNTQAAPTATAVPTEDLTALLQEREAAYSSALVSGYIGGQVGRGQADLGHRGAEFFSR